MDDGIDWSRTIHLIGDTHVGLTSEKRLEAVMADTLALAEAGGRPILHLQLGDTTDHGTVEQTERAIAWLDRLPGPWQTVMGNHEYASMGEPQWAEAYGKGRSNRVVELGPMTVVIVGPVHEEPGFFHVDFVSEETLVWLDQTLSGIDGDVVVACHCPLAQTHLGDDAIHFTSRDKFFSLPRTDALLEMMAGHEGVRAWVSGHTHSPSHVEGFVAPVPLGAGERTLAAVNASAVAYVGRDQDQAGALETVFLTVTDDAVVVRVRDHWNSAWSLESTVGRRPLATAD